jgi:hypothetical protein
MHLEFDERITAHDYAQAQMLHSGFRSQLYLAGFTAFTLSGFVVVDTTAHGKVDPLLCAIEASIWLLGIAVFAGCWPELVRKRSAKMFTQDKLLQLPYHFEIDDTSLSIRTEWGNQNVPWSSTHKWKSNDKMILVYANDLLFRMFPRRWFSSAADFAGFKELLARTVGPEGKSRKSAA